MDYCDMVSMVVPGLAGAPSFIVEEKIKEAAIEFCERTWAWEADLDAITTEIGTKAYTLTPIDDAVIVSVLSVADANENSLSFAVTADYSQIKLSSAPTTAFAMTATVVLIPDPDSAEIPDFLYNRYRETLIAGAKGKCFEMAGRPWSDPVSAAKDLGKFKKGITRANMARQNQRLSGSRVQMGTWV